MLKNKSLSFPFLLAVIFAIGFISLYYFSIDKGLVMDDEGWYLYLLKYQPNGIPSQFYKLIPNIFNGSIYSLRLFNFYFDLFSILVYSIGLYSFLKGKFNLSKTHLILFFCFTSIGFSLFTIPVCTTPYYVSLNKNIALIGFGLVLMALTKKSYSDMFLISSGFVTGFSFFVMITTTPIYLLYIILIYLYTPIGLRIKNISRFLIGIILSLTYYFLFVESLSVFINDEILPHISNTISAKHNENHGLIPIVRWSAIALKYLLFNGLLASLVIIGYNRIKPLLSQKHYYSLIILLVIAALFYYHENVINGEHAFAETMPFISLFIFFIIDQCIIHKNLKYLETFLIIILFIPLFLSIGSDVDFKTRLGIYSGFMFPLLYIICAKLYSKRFMQIFMIVVAFYSVNIYSMIFRNNWGYFTYAKQTIALKELNINQNLKIDSAHFTNLKYLQTALYSGDTVLLSNKRLWGYAYLLDLKPITYTFRATEDDYLKQLKNHPNLQKIKLFETVYAPFQQGTMENLKIKGNYYCTDTVLISEIYKVYTLKKKNI
jgi:hypothetical protein